MKKVRSPKVKFIADECVSNKTIKFLRSLGYKVESIFDLNLEGATNGRLIQLAKNERKVFITEDQDFSNIILYPPRLHHGIIVLKTSLEVEKRVHFILKTLLSELEASDFEKTLIIVDANKYRLRR